MAIARTAIAFTIVPGKALTLEAPADIRLGQVALSDVLADQKRSSLKLSYITALNPHIHDEDDEHDDDEEAEDKEYTVTLANLVPGVIETQTLGGLIINSGEKVIFEATGNNTLYLSGNVILQETFDEPPSDDELDSEDEEDEIYDEEFEGMDDGEKEAFLKALSRTEDMTLDDEPASSSTKPKSSATKKAIEASPKGETAKPLSKKEKKAVEKARAAAAAAAPAGTTAAAVSTTTTTTATITTTAPAAGANAEKPAAPESKKRKEVEGSKDAKEGKATNKEKEAAGSPAAKKAKGQDGKPVPTPAGEKKEEKKEKSKAPVEVRTTPSGLKISDRKVGEGPGAKPRQSLSMRYILKLGNGKIVDKNTNGKPFKFTLGAGEVIKGWDEGLVGMKVGGERTLEVPAPLGYGKRKSGDIPPNSTLFFEVKLLDIGK